MGQAAGDGGSSEKGLVRFEGGVLIFEVADGGEVHLGELFWSDGGEGCAVIGGFAVFDFCKVDVTAFDGDEVDFVEVGFVVVGDDGVAVFC